MFLLHMRFLDDIFREHDTSYCMLMINNSTFPRLSSVGTQYDDILKLHFMGILKAFISIAVAYYLFSTEGKLR